MNQKSIFSVHKNTVYIFSMEHSHSMIEVHEYTDPYLDPPIFHNIKPYLIDLKSYVYNRQAANLTKNRKSLLQGILLYPTTAKKIPTHNCLYKYGLLGLIRLKPQGRLLLKMTYYLQCYHSAVNNLLV